MMAAAVRPHMAAVCVVLMAAALSEVSGRPRPGGWTRTPHYRLFIKKIPKESGFQFKTKYFQQKVDHFGFSEVSTFKQRYLIADQDWDRNGGPILFYTGNEGDIVWFCNNTGFMWDISKEMKAMLVFAEHRYYGKSMPFGQKAFSDPKYLDYLTSEQALADFAVLIRNLKRTIPGAQNSPVIAMGGSYGGMLAAWLRMKYPHVVIGAIAASAPIWQFENMCPCGSYNTIVTKDFLKSGKGCAESIRNSWGAINKVSSTAEGLKFLSSIFHLCSPLQMDDVESFKGWLSETWVNLAMVDYPYAASFLEPLPAWPIKVVCTHLKDPSLSEELLLKKLFEAVSVYYNYTGNMKCLNISQTATSSLDDQAWYYQSCTEMVMPICADGINDMFEPAKWDFPAFSEDCYKTWGIRPRPDWIATNYGGKNISSHTNIVFSNGDLDPWSAGGVRKSISDTLVAITITDGAHHLDLRSKNPKDPPSVQKARTQEIQYMKKWIEKTKK